MRAKLLVVLVVGLLAAAEQKDDAKKEQDKLQGTWAAVEGGPPGGQLTFAGDKFTIRDTKENKDVAKGTFKVDPSKKPKTIDMTVTEDSEGGKYKGKTSLGIYELDGDQLKWCANEPGKTERPKEFVKEASGDRYLLITFKRHKP
jgi:uncharacterized protein (TIGR03067 family)